jgi:hypothetical protein
VYELLRPGRQRTIDEQRYEKGQEGEPRCSTAWGFWKHSVAVACASELIAAKHPAPRR